MVARRLDVGDVTALLLGQLADSWIGEQLRESQDGVQRRPHLVIHHRHQA